MAVSGSSPMSYEEARRQRMEENKRRMEELGLMDLSKNLKVANTPPRKQMKRRMPSLEELGLEARRSSRVAGKPTVSYRDQLDVLPGMRARCGTRERQGLARRYMSDKSRMAAIDRAEEVYKDITNPAFVKPMLHSHTASGFWLGLPALFCKTHLPQRDEHVMLEDETQKEWECVYLSNKVGLSGGWRGFSLDHDLIDGDCLIFELMTPTRFKIYIFRAQELEGKEDDDEVELIEGGAASGEIATEKKVLTKANGKKKGGASSAPAKIDKPRKLSATAARKLKLEKDDDNNEAEIDDEDDSPIKEPSKKDLKRGGKRAADADKAGPSRSSKRLRVKDEDEDGVKDEEDDNDVEANKGKNVRLSKRKGKEPAEDDIVDLNSDIEGEEDAWKPSSRSKAKQSGPECRSSGRVTRNSVAKLLI